MNNTGHKTAVNDNSLKALKESEARYRRLFETAQDGILILDAGTGKIQDVNPFLLNLLGYTCRELSGKKLWEISLFKDIAANKAAFEELKQKGYIRYHDLPLKTKNNQTTNVEFISNSYDVEGKKVIQCNIRDISDRAQAETIIAEQNSRLLSIINSTDDILIFSVDRNYRYTGFNEAHRKMMRDVWRVHIRIGMNLLDCMTIPELREGAKISLDRVLAGQCFKETQYQPEQKIWFEFNWNPILNEKGAVVGVTSFIRDVTERKQNETTMVEIEALTKISQAKSDLLANVSHELRTPLSAIKGFIETMIETDVNWSDAQKLDFLQSADAETDRLILMIRDLLDMSRLDSGKLILNKELVRFDEILDLISSALSSISAKHELKIIRTPQLPPVNVDKSRIAQVITNLVENATKFSPPGSRITIASRISDSKVMVRVSDNGIGMPPDVVANLFDRFYQAKEVVSGKTRGTGLGLAICKGILEAHGERIWVESRMGKGATFSFTLPIGQEQ